MKKRAAFCLIFIAVIMLISSCSQYTAVTEQTPEPTPVVTPEPTNAETPSPTEAPASPPAAAAEPVKGVDKVITVFSYTDEVPRMIEKYKKLHPEFAYEINATVIATVDDLYEPALDEALAAGGSGAPDIYCADSAFVMKYTQDKMSGYAMPYEDLGINIAAKTVKAKTAQYIIDIGTRPSDGKVVGLGYQSTAGVFIYRRSIAKKTWGTDKPAVIKTKVGPGWDKFFEAAAQLKKKGYAIVSGDGDIWHSVENSADKGWIVDGKLYIDPKREAFLDYSKELTDKGYSNGTQDWTEDWYKDMRGAGKKKVFGFFGPAWLINYIMVPHCGARFDGNGKLVRKGGTWGDWAVCVPPAGFFWGGSWVLASKTLEYDPDKKAAVAGLIDWITLNCAKDGLQYSLANGKLYGSGGKKDTVASGTVMAASNGKLAFLKKQNMYDSFVSAGQLVQGGNITEYDSVIGNIWRGQVRQYTAGYITRDEAVAGFKRAVKDQLGIDAW